VNIIVVAVEHAPGCAHAFTGTALVRTISLRLSLSCRAAPRAPLLSLAARHPRDGCKNPRSATRVAGRAMRVLFCHGLESGPGGRKPRVLAACGHSVTCVAMPCSAQGLLWDPLVLLLGAALVGLLVAAPALLLLLPLLWLLRARLTALVRPLAVRRVFARCVAVQEVCCGVHTHGAGLTLRRRRRRRVGRSWWWGRPLAGRWRWS
jgi:hypothetical protein